MTPFSDEMGPYSTLPIGRGLKHGAAVANNIQTESDFDSAESGSLKEIRPPASKHPGWGSQSLLRAEVPRRFVESSRFVRSSTRCRATTPSLRTARQLPEYK